MDSSISCSSAYLFPEENWKIFSIKLEGIHLPGSYGNEQVESVKEALRSILVTHSPIGVLIDVRQLDYKWGIHSHRFLESFTPNVFRRPFSSGPQAVV